MSSEKFDADIIVVGGGLTGISAAISAARLGFVTTHLSPKTAEDKRTSALMGPSVQFLEDQGFVDTPDDIGTPLRKIRIIDATNRLVRAPETLFDSAEIDQDAFGWNFPNALLGKTIAKQTVGLANYTVIDTSFETMEPIIGGYRVETTDGRKLTARMVVGADGKKSSVRRLADIGVKEQRFAQSALVCDLKLGRSLDGTSVEFHYPKGPFTLVPAGGDDANLVWIDDHAKLQAVLEKPSNELAELFRQQAQNIYGPIELLTKPVLFPLGNLTATVAGKAGVALVGEAIHAFPPIGAQGLNLGLRDVADLIAVLKDVDQTKENWAVTASDAYAQKRSGDLWRTASMVDALFKSLLTDMLPTQAARAGGLWALRLMPSLRRQAFSIGMGNQ